MINKSGKRLPIFNSKKIQDKLLDGLTRKDAIEWIEQQSVPYRELMSYYKCAMMEVETKFKVLNQELSLKYDRNPIETIKSRLKDPMSLLEKLKRKGLSLNSAVIQNNIYDIAGIRVICSFPEDIYMLANCLLEQDDVTLVEIKDYIKNPKENGYRSLHLIIEVPIYLVHEKKMVKVEIQLRTIAMDFWASLEHKLKYKKDIENEQALTDELKECADISANLDMRMEAIRKKIEEKI